MSATTPLPRASTRPALRYANRPRRLTAGNEVLPLIGGGETYPAMLAAIAGAEHSVCLEVYIFESDRTGARFIRALCAAARRGVAVRLIVDGVGSFDLGEPALVAMRAAGVEVIEFHPVAPWRKRFNLTRRDHRKILVVDDRVGFTGGLNIGDEYAPIADGGKGWHDVHCEIRGPAVLHLARAFRRVWLREGGSPYEIHRGRVTTAGDSLVGIVDNRELRKRWGIRRAYLYAINRAESEVAIANGYFLPDRGVRRALERCAARGVRVRVMVPRNSDVKAVQYAGEYMYGRLIRKGIQILCWTQSMMHAKTAVIDGEWSTIGSYNLDSRSLRYNLEVVAEIIDPELGHQMLAQFESDAARCEALSFEQWRNRGRFRRLLGWFFYQLRKWL